MACIHNLPKSSGAQPVIVPRQSRGKLRESVGKPLEGSLYPVSNRGSIKVGHGKITKPLF